MTILFLSRFFYPHIGGVEKHIWEIAVRLIEGGHRVIVVSEQGKDRYQSAQESAREERIYDFGLATDQTYRKKSERGKGQLSVYKISVPGSERLKKWLIWWWLICHRMLIEKADIIHCHDVFSWYLPFRFIYIKKPVYTTFHGYETVFPPTRKAIIVRKLSERLSMGNICIGDYIKKWYGTKPTYTTYGGVGILPIRTNITNKYQSKKLKKKVRILFVGRLEEDTGVLIYLETLKKLRKRNIPFEFEACGDGSLREEVEKWGRVHGFVKNLNFYLEWADIVFASSYLSILEALATKRLVYSVYNNSLKKDYLRLAPFANYIVIAESPEQLANRITRGKYIREGYEWVKGQTWDNIVDLYLKLWKL